MNNLAYEILSETYRHMQTSSLNDLCVKLMGEDGQVYGHHHSSIKLVLDIEEGMTHIDIISNEGGILPLAVEDIKWFKVCRG